SEDKTDDAAKEYRTKLVAALNGALRDLGGAIGLFIDVGVEHPVDLAITDIELPRSITGQPRQVFAAGETFLLRVHLKATGKDFTNQLQCLVGKEPPEREVILAAGEQISVPFDIDLEKLNFGPGEHSLEVRLKAHDSLAFNDFRYLTFAVQRPRRILVLADEPFRATVHKGTRGFKDYLELLGFQVDLQTAPPESL